MPKPHNVYDPMTGALRRKEGAPRPNKVQFAHRPMDDNDLSKAIDVTEKRARAIIRGRGSIGGRRIA